MNKLSDQGDETSKYAPAEYVVTFGEFAEIEPPPREMPTEENLTCANIIAGNSSKTKINLFNNKVPYSSPMSSFQSWGRSAMNFSIMLMHSSSWTTSVITPREKRRFSSPMNVLFSPMITLGIP